MKIAVPDALAGGPFSGLAREVCWQGAGRARITAAYRRPEVECLPPLLESARLPEGASRTAEALARTLVGAVRAKQPRGGLQALLHEYALTTQEGVALMCLAEALLRIPDAANRDALIRDKIGRGDWRAHLGHGDGLFTNAATWALLLTGTLTQAQGEAGLAASLKRALARGGEPLIRAGLDIAIHLMGAHFIAGEMIAQAMARARALEARGFRYSYDMLGEAAVTAQDADRYHGAYEQAVRVIGEASAGQDVDASPGISIKLSALHPRYVRAQRGRVMTELWGRLRHLAVLARRYEVGLSIDAEESDRLDLSLDLLEALCAEPELAGWNGLGFVVQAYQKRAAPVVDYLIELARATRHRLMVRLVKGAYWDTEIKRAQQDGVDDFPVFTRKAHTDVSYLACARKLLQHCDEVFPQFATHNARTIATVFAMSPAAARYEFQCLHGMGEALYAEVVGALNRPCRIYAPVGAHMALLPYLVRRLLENGANTSFVNQLSDPGIRIDALVADPVRTAAAIAPCGAPHPAIARPPDLFGAERPNSRGFDFADESELARLAEELAATARTHYRAAPLLAHSVADGAVRAIGNPADRRDIVGQVIEATEREVAAALDFAEAGALPWARTAPAERAARLRAAADLLQAHRAELLGLLVREAGKTLPDAASELREAVDFLRYYAGQAEERLSGSPHRSLGAVACISPWNFPLSIFIGQIAAALAAGNAVLAKPAEETPLIAAAAARLMRKAGVPAAALQLLPGPGEIGALLVADPRIAGVAFTGSLGTAQAIQRCLAARLGADGKPVPLIAETGGRNAMIVDSTARLEQAVNDILLSAFDAAGQRCSALRLLCVQEEAAQPLLAMLGGAMAELAVGNPDRLATDIGPVITQDAAREIAAHVREMRARGYRTYALPLPDACSFGNFVPPTLVEIDQPADVPREVFGPVLHVLRYRRAALGDLIAAINAAGFALAGGIQTRVDEAAAHVTARIAAGNVYVNRSMIGAVVGSQPFGGYALSGTGPKAGGPLYLRRMLAKAPESSGLASAGAAVALRWAAWLDRAGWAREAARCRSYHRRSPLGAELALPGPVGERNLYRLEPRGRVLCVAETRFALAVQIGAALATGNAALIVGSAAEMVAQLPADLRGPIACAADLASAAAEAALFAGPADALLDLQRRLAERDGSIVQVQALSPDALESGADDYALEWLCRERTISINTAAIGGVPHLSGIG